VPRAFAVIAALGLSACGHAYYAYDYDPYLGPRGHYVSPYWGPYPPPPPPPCRPIYAGPYEAGYRGSYLSGPYCAPTSEADQ
jgi:hypothetical protein